MFRKFIYTGILSLIIGSCGGSDDLPPEEEIDTLTIPQLLFPTNNLLCINNSIDFRWSNANEFNSSLVSYVIEISDDIQFSTLAHTESINDTEVNFNLEKGVAYYWRVKATAAGIPESGYSPIFSFYTEGNAETNHLPFSPVLISPKLDSLAQSPMALLEWNANDVDIDDILSFDVHLDTIYPPANQVGTDLDAKDLNVNVIANKEYFWKVTVRDDKGGETIGQVWRFITN